MNFGPVSFSPSSSIAAMAEGVSGALESLKEGFTEGAAALGSLGLPAPGPGDLLELMEKAREEATQALATPVKFMAITPFQYGVGTRKGEHAFLTPAKALETLRERLPDVDLIPTESGAVAALSDKAGFDPALPVEHTERPQERTNVELALVLLIVATPTHALMGQALEAFNKVYPIAQLEQACRRAKALATLETDKFVIPEGPGFPAWGEASPQKDAKGQAVAKALGGMVAAGEGAAKAAAAPAGMLASFAKKQAGKIAQKAADLAALAESMAGGFDAWVGVSLQGEGPVIFRELAKIAPPFDESFKCTSLLCWFGKPAEVAYYKESFGL